MSQRTEAEIAAAEDRLRIAMVDSDVAALDELLAPELMFTNHLGQLSGKEEDLAAHRSGVLKIEKLSLSDRQIRLFGDIAIVSVRAQLSGKYAGKPANGEFRFTRVWALSSLNTWRVVAAHAGIMTS